MSGDRWVGVPPPPVRLYIGAPSPEFKLGRAFLLCDTSTNSPGTPSHPGPRNQFNNIVGVRSSCYFIMPRRKGEQKVLREPSQFLDEPDHLQTLGDLLRGMPIFIIVFVANFFLFLNSTKVIRSEKSGTFHSCIGRFVTVFFLAHDFHSKIEVGKM
jgi:hypothetical protein